jgi:hypothetical protein
MTSKLALVHLYEVVTAMLKADQVPVTSLFGWRIPAQHPMGNRIAWVPGDLGGTLGETGPARYPGGEPRSLATLNELFTVVINGQDLTEPEDELKQYSVVRYIRDAWYRAVYHAAYGVFAIRSEQWVTTRLERRHGAALRIVGEIQAAVRDEAWPDQPSGEVPPPFEADLTVDELDVSETFHVSGADTP